jgi:hypothetical protein
MMKGFSTGFVIIAVAALLVLGGWWYYRSQPAGPAGTESTSTPATGGTATTGNSAPAPLAPTTVAATGNANIDASVSGITKSADAYSTQASSEDGTEGAAQLNTSLNNQPAYVQ